MERQRSEQPITQEDKRPGPGGHRIRHWSLGQGVSGKTFWKEERSKIKGEEELGGTGASDLRV